MYSIPLEIIVKIFFFLAFFKYTNIMTFLNKHNYIRELFRFYKFVCDNNPYDYDLYVEEDQEPDIIVKETDKPIRPRYEDKYLDKFKQFPNEFHFTEIEIEQQQIEYNNIKSEYTQKRADLQNINQQKLMIINEIQTKGNVDHSCELFTSNMNKLGIHMLVILFDMLEEYEDDPDSFDLEELYSDLLKLKEDLLKEMSDMEQHVLSDDDLLLQARELIVNNKLDKFINNYILECTPQGNVYMRYNNDKKSFEYFSNNSIPYRYLEPLARKYVITYWCKPIFVSMEDELKRSEEKYDEDKKKQILQESNKPTNPRLAQLKNYNKTVKDTSIKPMKNRTNANFILPPQIKSNLPDVNKPSDKQLLKEKANRYTWEGRLSDFCPLKKIDRKITDKKLAMTYADFKKLQQK